MPTPGLSLVGFMDQQDAVDHLAAACVSANPDPNALVAEWVAAKARLGAPMQGAGQPDIQPIPPKYQPHFQALLTSPWGQQVFQGPLQNITFQLVEIDKLLAYQFAVDTDRTNHHCGRLTSPPTLDELVPLCIPLAPQGENFQTFQGQQSILLTARSLNVQSLANGMFNAAFMGIHFGATLPFLHVVRHNGRCYLHNGFHRIFGARKAGATHIPCIFRDVPDHAAIGLKDKGTFQPTLLESVNPPTVGHLTQGRAHPVSLRSVSRVLHVSWAEYVIPNE